MILYHLQDFNSAEKAVQLDLFRGNSKVQLCTKTQVMKEKRFFEDTVQDLRKTNLLEIILEKIFWKFQEK